jgi:hypothetical protein
MRKLLAMLFLAALAVVIFLPKDFMGPAAPLAVASSGLAPTAPKT